MDESGSEERREEVKEAEGNEEMCLDSGGPAEQVEDGITGFVVDPDSASIAEALTRALSRVRPGSRVD